MLEKSEFDQLICRAKANKSCRGVEDMAGIKDVAKRAKVGVGTVSRMINNSGYVSVVLYVFFHNPNRIFRRFQKSGRFLQTRI